MNYPAGLLVASKSSWMPAIRREHALARLASRKGHPVTFLEAADDVRTARDEAVAWARRLSHPVRRDGGDGIELVARSTLLPAHRNRVSEAIDTRLLRRALSALSDDRTATIAVTFPWNWAAVAPLRGVRKVFDVADDWGALIPARSRRVSELYKRVAQEADAISVVSEQMRDRFPDRDVTVVRNAVDETLLRTPLSAAPGERRLVYVGTLSERFDATLAGQILDRLPNWRLDLFGQCRYAQMGTRPGPELTRLLARGDRSVRWHGPVGRDRLAAVLDSADVLLLPNRAEHSRGQDSMKMYDYCARGRPIVASDGAVAGMSESPPHLRSGGDAGTLAALVTAASNEPERWSHERAAWAGTQSWDARWPDWSVVLFGEVADVGPAVAARVNREPVSAFT
jgi:glycosyltransferase involved in cell wall biosynthesis